MVILIKKFVADYCTKSNRHQEKTMPETVFYFTMGTEEINNKMSDVLHSSFISAGDTKCNQYLSS